MIYLQNEKKTSGQILRTPPHNDDYDNYALNQNTWAPKANTWEPPKDTYVPPQSTWTPPASDFTPPANDWTPPQSTWTPPQDIWIPPPSAYPNADQVNNTNEDDEITVVKIVRDSAIDTPDPAVKKASISSTSSSASVGQTSPMTSLTDSITDQAVRREIQGMQRLIEMGFANREQNRALLAKFEGDLEKVVQSLLQEEGEDHWAFHRH